MNTIATELEQLHDDATHAVKVFRLAALDFKPTCDFHRIYKGVEVPATHSFTCRGCKTVELRCFECVVYFSAQPHMGVGCQCGWYGCFHAVVLVTQLGGTS